ncbi:hypothetical protein NM688_g8907 [Phlebia brevispora]|uniref:Uncharacterized protein n=1 Tax=Phlebia brevispora TaxID=194682 RepID=A0ACC1RLL4_9APHY|nr:hypothetical protein NM688_g8907 [Phlebia brevispora]
MRGHDTFLGDIDANLDPLLAMSRPMYGDMYESTVAPEDAGAMSEFWMTQPDQLGADGFMPSMFTGDGTIDPSLLGGLPMQMSQPPYSSPPLSPAGSVEMEASGEYYTGLIPPSSSRPTSPIAGPSNIKRGPGRPEGSAKGKGKGTPKEELESVRNYASAETHAEGTGQEHPRFKPVRKPGEYFGFAPDVNAVAGDLSAENIVAGRRNRKISTRGRESMMSSEKIAKVYLGSLIDEGSGSQNADSRSPSVSLSHPPKEMRQNSAKETKRVISTEPKQVRRRRSQVAKGPGPAHPYCHQCRRAAPIRKMRCSATREDGLPCGLRFCERCVLIRYPDMVFDDTVNDFVCPKCSGFCNCTHCCDKRGEQYVSTRGVKTNVPKISAPDGDVSLDESSSLSKVRRKAKQVRIVTPEDVPLDPSMMLPDGASWGTVYTVDGCERMGSAVVLSKRKQQLALQLSKPPLRRFIGIPQRGWKFQADSEAPDPPPPKGRAYIGSPQPMYEWYVKQCFDGELTPTSSDDETQADEGAESGMRSIPSDDLPFLIANVIASANNGTVL